MPVNTLPLDKWGRVRCLLTYAIKHNVQYKGYVIKGYRHSANGELLPSNVEENPVGNGA